jgi:hypothetical protein
MYKNIFHPFFDERVNVLFERNIKILHYLRNKLSSNISNREKNIVEYGFKINSNTYLNSGDIVFRPLSFLKDDLSLSMNHYGIVFGKMKNGDCLILENSDNTHIGFKTLSEFCEPHSIDKIEIEKNDSDISFEDILKRAKEVEFNLYSAIHFNCRHFVTYCVYGEKYSEQVEHVKDIVLPILNICSAYLNLIECDTKKPDYLDEIQNLANSLNSIKNNIRL